MAVLNGPKLGHRWMEVEWPQVLHCSRGQDSHTGAAWEWPLLRRGKRMRFLLVCWVAWV